MDNAYITLENLDRFRKNLRRSTAGQGTGARVLHNRMISYYSQPGEVYSVVKRMRIPRVKAGDSFCLEGIVEDGTTAEYLLTESLICPEGRPAIIGYKVGDEKPVDYLDFDESTLTLTVRDEISELYDQFEYITIIIPTRLKQQTHECSLGTKGYGCFNRNRRLVWNNEYCVRPFSEIGIDGHVFDVSRMDAQRPIQDFELLQKRGVEVEILKAAGHKPISPRRVIGKSESAHDSSRAVRKIIAQIENAADMSLMDIDPNQYDDVWCEYVRHLQRAHGRRCRWRWLRCTKWPDFRSMTKEDAYYYVRLRTRRGKEVSQWRIYRITRNGYDYCHKEPARVRLDL